MIIHFWIKDVYSSENQLWQRGYKLVGIVRVSKGQLSERDMGDGGSWAQELLSLWR